MPLNFVLRRFAFYCHNIVLLKKQAPELSEACFVNSYLLSGYAL